MKKLVKIRNRTKACFEERIVHALTHPLSPFILDGKELQRLASYLSYALTYGTEDNQQKQIHS